MAGTITPTEHLEEQRRAAQLAYGDAVNERNHRFAVYHQAAERGAPWDELQRLWIAYQEAQHDVIAKDQARAEAIAALHTRIAGEVGDYAIA